MRTPPPSQCNWGRAGRVSAGLTETSASHAAQPDGNLVLYNASVHIAQGGGSLFSSQTCCATAPYSLRMLPVRIHARVHVEPAVRAVPVLMWRRCACGCKQDRGIDAVPRLSCALLTPATAVGTLP